MHIGQWTHGSVPYTPVPWGYTDRSKRQLSPFCVSRSNEVLCVESGVPGPGPAGSLEGRGLGSRTVSVSNCLYECRSRGGTGSQ